MERKSGILLPISSLPSRYGIGTMGKETYAFADFLKQAVFCFAFGEGRAASGSCDLF